MAEVHQSQPIHQFVKISACFLTHLFSFKHPLPTISSRPNFVINITAKMVFKTISISSIISSPSKTPNYPSPQTAPFPHFNSLVPALNYNYILLLISKYHIEDCLYNYMPIITVLMVSFVFMEDSRYAINGKLWKVKKGYKQQRIACI
jgi:hypothetical protein